MKAYPGLKSILAAVSLLLFSVAQAAPESGHEHCDMPPPGHHGIPDDKFMDGPMPPFVHGLNLSEAQRDAVFKIVYAQMPLMRDKTKSLHKSEEALRALTLSGQYDDAKAKTLAEAIANDMVQLSLLRAQSEHQIYMLLTPEQRKQAEELKSRFEDFHHANDRDDKSQGRPRAI